MKTIFADIDPSAMPSLGHGSMSSKQALIWVGVFACVAIIVYFLNRALKKNSYR